MEFRIADTFTDSLARLTGDEQKAVKTTAFDLQLNPAQAGLQLHKLDKPIIGRRSFQAIGSIHRYAGDKLTTLSSSSPIP